VLSQGWQVSADLTFIDDGYTGGNLERPALGKLRKLIKAGRVDCVVVFKVDRLSRSVIDTVNLVLNEWDGRTHLKSAREPIDTTTAMGKQFFYMLVSYAEWERSVIRERTVSGRRRRAEQGYKPSAIAPYGYRHSAAKKGALEIAPTEAEVVREIFRLCNTGLGAKAITNHLNAQRTPYHHGAMWSDKTVLYMLQNRAYIGDMVYGKTTRNPRYGKEPGAIALLKTLPVVVENSAFMPPIVSREVFRLARNMIQQRQKGPGKPSGRANTSGYLLSGIARCRCGYGLFVKEQYRRHNQRSAYTYVCMGKRIRGTQKCDCAPIPMAELDAEIEQRVKHRFGGATVQEAFLRRVTASHAQERRLREAELVAAERQLGELEEQAKKVHRDYRTDRISAEEYRALKGEIEQEAAALRAQCLGLKTSLAQSLATERGSLLVREQLSRVDHWGTLAATEKKNVLRFFIERMVAYRQPAGLVVDVELGWLSAGAGLLDTTFFEMIPRV
jgi:site-specific DNA recombinase